MLTPFAVFLFMGCVPLPGSQTTSYTYTTDYVYEPHIDPTNEAVRLITNDGIEIVELSDNQIKMLVYFEGPKLELMLVVPEGEALLIDKSHIEVLDAAVQQNLDKFEVRWSQIDSQLKKNSGRLVGLKFSPPVTRYHAYDLLFIDQGEANEIILKLPDFETTGGETIKFEDIKYRVLTASEVKAKHKYRYIPLIPF